MNLFLESFNTRTHGSSEASTAFTSSDDSATALSQQSRSNSTPRTWDSFSQAWNDTWEAKISQLATAVADPDHDRRGLRFKRHCKIYVTL